MSKQPRDFQTLVELNELRQERERLWIDPDRSIARLRIVQREIEQLLKREYGEKNI